jgi:hypothetical protein
VGTCTRRKQLLHHVAIDDRASSRHGFRSTERDLDDLPARPIEYTGGHPQRAM